MRAIENGLPLIQVANTGMTGIVDRYGQAEIGGPIYSKFAKITTLDLDGQETFFRRTGHYQAVVIVILTLYLLFRALYFYKKNNKKYYWFLKYVIVIFLISTLGVRVLIYLFWGGLTYENNAFGR